MKHGRKYLIVVWDDVDPQRAGPFKTADTRLAAARRIRRDFGADHGIYKLDISSAGIPDVSAFTGAELAHDGGPR